MISLEQTRTLDGGLLVPRDPKKNVCLPVKNRLVLLGVNSSLQMVALYTLKMLVQAAGTHRTNVLCLQVRLCEAQPKTKLC